MASSSFTKVLDNIGSITQDLFLPRLVDNFFTSMPLLIRLMEREQITEDGGDQIRQPIIHTNSPADAYVGLEVFDTSDTDTMTAFQFDWKQYFGNITVPGTDMIRNGGGSRAVLDVVQAKMQIAELSLKDQIATDVFGDGTRRAGVITGLNAAIDDGSNTPTYGGISRTSGAVSLQNAAKGNLDAAGGSLTLDIMQSNYGSASIANENPDMIITSQVLWDKVWARVQPQQRFPADRNSDRPLAKAGFSTITFNNADVVVDNHVPAGTMYFLNTNYIEMIIHRDRNFDFTGFKEPSDQDAQIGQILLATELVVSSPRLQARATGLT